MLGSGCFYLPEIGMKRIWFAALLAVGLTATATVSHAQVTTGSLTGRVSAKASATPLQGARVRALHVPSGTAYQAISRADGRFNIPGMRVGGPYTITATMIGFAPQEERNVVVQLGVSTEVTFQIATAAVQLTAVSVTAQSGGVLSASRNGAATTVGREAITQLPTISRNINDFTRLTPQASGTSFAGQDTRLNNITVDGSYFNNSFGLGSVPGARTNVSPISIDAIDQIQVNVAPFDVRQGNFVGAGVNAVTKSGTNTFIGSTYRLGRNESNGGTSAGALPVNQGTFNFSQWGAYLGGPIIKNKLFFFTSYDTDENERPGSLFTSNSGSETVIGNKTRVLDADLQQLSTFLKDKLGYETGSYQNYPFLTPSDRFLVKLDFNANDNNKFTVRYNQLNSLTDVLASGSNAIGNGNRNNSTQALSFQNSNYTINENNKSLVGEWNSQIGSRVSNNMIVGYTKSDESRGIPGGLFPIVDILQAGTTYTSFGTEAFTPFNELRYNTLQFQNNLSITSERHDVTLGVTAQRYRSENSFYSGSQSAYVYNSLNDFYTDVNDYVANPNRTVSPVTLNRFQLRYANIPGLSRPPLQLLDVLYAGAFIQDEIRVSPRLKISLGLRVDIPKFKQTGAFNSAVPSLVLRDEIGQNQTYSTSQLPGAKPLWSPRFGFNWDARGNRSTQVRGGSGVFTGPPPYVWISNQIGSNGILAGFEQTLNTTTRPFNPDPLKYAPANVTGAPAATYELNLTDRDYKFPQIWRSNLALDQRLPWGMVGTVEYLYNQDLNGPYYVNANLPVPQSAFGGADKRPRWTNNRINSNITAAFVLKNQNVGSSYNIAASLEKAYRGGFFAKAAYAYGSARNTIDPGSTAGGTFNGNQISGNPNNPNVGFGSGWSGHRSFLVMSYKKQYFGFGSTGVSVFNELRSIGNATYSLPFDINGDGGTGNDLLYVARNTSEMNFQEYSVTSAGAVTTVPANIARTFTVAEQTTAWERYIQQDPHLKERRGQYAERGAVFLPTLFRSDLSFTQDVFAKLGGATNRFQFRVDVLNIGNLINKDWGGSQRLRSNQPLVSALNPGATTNFTIPVGGQPLYRLRNIGTSLIPSSFERTANLADAWSMQFQVRYFFN
jgi:Carboxypeptidase regulatory-like domain